MALLANQPTDQIMDTAIHIVTNHDHRTVTSTNGGQSMTNGRLKNGTTVSDPISANRQGALTRTMRNLRTRKKTEKIIERVAITLFILETDSRMANIPLFANWDGATFLQCG